MASESGGVGVLASHTHSSTAGDGGNLSRTVTVFSPDTQASLREMQEQAVLGIYGVTIAPANGIGLGLAMAVG